MDAHITYVFGASDNLHAGCLVYEAVQKRIISSAAKKSTIVLVRDNSTLRTGKNVTLIEFERWEELASDHQYHLWNEFKMRQAYAHPPVLWRGKWCQELGEPFKNGHADISRLEIADPQPVFNLKYVNCDSNCRWGQWVQGRGVVNELLNQPLDTIGIWAHNCVLWWLIKDGSWATRETKTW